MILWQGFDARWRYNHRLNRLGSAVQNGEVTQHAASGTGPDRATLRTHVAHVDADIFEGDVTLRLRGKENEPLSAEATILSPGGIPVLQGFDTYAVDSADKPIHFALSVTPVPDSEAFVVRAEWKGACSTAECKNDGTTDQIIRVYYGVLPDVRLASATHEAATAWTKKERSGATTHPATDVTAITGIALTLSDEMHWLAYETSIDEGKLTLGFENWEKGMRCARFPEALFSFRQAGSAQISVDTVQLRLSSTPETIEETQRWRGYGRTPTYK